MSVATLLDAASLYTLPLEQSQSAWHAGRDAQQRLYDLLVPLFEAGRVYPDTAHENREFPDCVYSVSDTGSIAYRNMDISHSVLFGLSIRDKNSADLMEQFDLVADVLHSQSGIQILGYATGFEENTEDGGNYVIGIEVLLSHPIGFDSDQSPNYPLLTLPGKEEGIEAQYDNCGTQTIRRDHHVLYHANSQADLKQRRQQVKNVLHYKKLDDAFRPLEFIQGAPVQSDGGLIAWVDVWQDQYRMKPTRHA